MLLLLALLTDPVLLQSQYEEGQLLRQTLTFELRPAEDTGETTAAQTRLSITATELTVTVGSDSVATCSWRPSRVTGQLQLADPAAPPLAYRSNQSASVRSELEAEAFAPYLDLDRIGLRYEATPRGDRTLLKVDSEAPDADVLAAALLRLQTWTLPAEAVQPGATWTDDADRSYEYVGVDDATDGETGDAAGRHRIAVRFGQTRGVLFIDPDLNRLAEVRLRQTLPDGMVALTEWTLEEADDLELGL